MSRRRTGLRLRIRFKLSSRTSPWRLLLLLFVLASLAAAQQARPAVLPQDSGAPGLDQAIRKLKTTARLLQITAHPDDEDGAMFALESRGRGVEAMLFSLTRGDGGQNKTGSNLFDELGVLRTLELLESSRYYGVSLRFSRLADFGFSKSPQETFAKWGHGASTSALEDPALEDTVRIIRSFRPDVLASAWSGTARDGHGHHQASGLLTFEAVRAAADPARFPAQLREGLLPWQVKKLYYRTREDFTLRLDAGVRDPDLGASYAEFGVEGYSHQASQNATRFAVPAGPVWRSYRRVIPEPDKTAAASTGNSAAEQDFFDGLDESLPGLAARLEEDEPKLPGPRAALREIAALVDQAADQAASSRAALPLIIGREKVAALIAAPENARLSPAHRAELLTHLQTKLEQFDQAAQLASGLHFEIIKQGSNLVVPGQAFDLTAVILNANAGPQPLAIAVDKVDLHLPAGWQQRPAKSSAPPRTLGPGETARLVFHVTVPANAELTRPYWHRDDPEHQTLHTIDDRRYQTLPFPPPPITAEMVYGIAGHPERARATTAASNDDGKRTTIAVVPAVSLLFDHASSVLRFESDVTIMKPMSLPFVQLTIRSNVEGSNSATVSVLPPPGWRCEPSCSHAVSFEHAAQEHKVGFQFRPESLSESRLEIRAEAESQGKKYAEGFSVVTRNDLATFYYYQPAVQKLSVVSTKVPTTVTLVDKNDLRFHAIIPLRVGYVPGAGDDILPVLQELGLDASEISAEQLASGDLSHFQTIVLGIRAYDAREDVRKQNSRLLDFVKQGGTLIVQNNFSVDAFNQGHYTPYPTMLSSDRVSVEDAPVEILAPADPIFQSPNRITARDFDGWVQERGVNFMKQWDSHFQPLLASHDPSDPPLSGGLLRARYGEGTYIYTGYAFFRQLPAGVPGAIRLYMNLLAAGHEHDQR